MMGQGLSWSGRERNNAYLNLGDGRFADFSHASGLDFDDDGRAVAAVDWDGDGDLDLWLKNRTGPQLRYMRNDGAPDGHWLALKLEGTTANRDAVGATVELVAGADRRRRSVTAGDGYLAQSSRWLHFGLGDLERVERLVIRWPGGDTEELPGPAVDRGYRVKQGSGQAVPRPARQVSGLIDDAAVPDLAEPRPPRLAPVLLKEPLPLPPTLRGLAFGDGSEGRAKLISLWAHWCAPCLEELSGLAGRHAEIRSAGADVMALNLDVPDDREQAARMLKQRIGSTPFGLRDADESTADLLDALLDHVLGREGELPLPTSLLVDESGMIQMIYVGPLTVDRLLADLERWVASPVNDSERGLYPGRWYFKTPRDLIGLAAELKRRDLRDDARFYLGLAHVGPSGAVSGN